MYIKGVSSEVQHVGSRMMQRMSHLEWSLSAAYSFCYWTDQCPDAVQIDDIVPCK